LKRNRSALRHACTRWLCPVCGGIEFKDETRTRTRRWTGNSAQHVIRKFVAFGSAEFRSILSLARDAHALLAPSNYFASAPELHSGSYQCQLATAVNAHFTNGTPMRDVEAVLGRPSYTRTRTPIPPETQKPMVWVYGFGSGQIVIRSTGAPATPVRDRRFAGARVLALDNSSQLDGSANRSQPIRPVTNQTPAAAASGR